MSELTIASASAFAQANIRSKVDVAVAKQAQDATRAQGDAAVSLIQSAAGFATRAAISASPAPGETGGRLDLTA